jgi:hypothetical protein
VAIAAIILDGAALGYDQGRMARLAATLVTTATTVLLLAPAALAHDGGEGWWGETSDKIVTNAGFILIGFFPLLVFLLSMLQGRLDKRKNERKAAAKARLSSADWRGGW